jgi:alanyl-tRNA synthetase
MTERLYYDDCYLREFQAKVVDTTDNGTRVYLDRTAFYPTSGGQPFDLGTVGGAAVRDVIDEDDRIAHVLDAPVAPGDVAARIDWERRFDHMQQHTGQHLLSAVLIELFDIPTVSFHMGAVTSTIEVAAPQIDPARMERAEERCAEIVAEARPVSISYEDSSVDLGLRKASARTGTLRIVSIDRLDRSACGGTHVRSTAEIGPVLLRKLEKIRGNVRIEFVCGMRAVRRARQDFRTLSEISRLVSVPSDEAPAIIAAQVEKLHRAWRPNWPNAKARSCMRPLHPTAKAFGEPRSAARSTMPCVRGRRLSCSDRSRYFWRFPKIRRRCCWPRRPIRECTRAIG